MVFLALLKAIAEGGLSPSNIQNLIALIEKLIALAEAIKSIESGNPPTQGG